MRKYSRGDLPYGDAHAYGERIDKVRDDFKDLKGRK
jgi:hypothetical protein